MLNASSTNVVKTQDTILTYTMLFQLKIDIHNDEILKYTSYIEKIWYEG